MASVDPKHVFSSPWPDMPIPETTLTDFVFQDLGDADHGHGDKKAFINALDVSKFYTYAQFKKMSYQVRGQ
jgi:hypothetical protein